MVTPIFIYQFNNLSLSVDTVSECKSETICVHGHDLESTLYNFLDEWLYNFCADPFFVPFKIEIAKFNRSVKPIDTESNIPSNNSDADNAIEIEAIGFGESFDLEKHPQGTEEKAITYSAMQINENSNFAEVFVIIDI